MKAERIKDEEFEPIKVMLTIETEEELDVIQDASDQLCADDISGHTLYHRVKWVDVLNKISRAAGEEDE